MPKITLTFEDVEDEEADLGKGVSIDVQVDGTTEGEMSTAESVASAAFNYAVDLLEKASKGEVEFAMIEEEDKGLH